MTKKQLLLAVIEYTSMFFFSYLAICIWFCI